MEDKLALHGNSPVRTEPFPQWPIFDKTDERRVIAAIRSGKWGKIDGSEVAEFEKTFAEYHQAKHAVAVVNGTTALRLALLAAGIEQGDEVIVPPLTFIATASAVVEANATPIFVDIGLDTFNIDPVAIEEAITPRTRAVIPVHLGGLPADMDAIMEIARRHNLVVIEDAAHAHGAEYKGRRVGAIGHMGTFSFQSSKNLTAGEGGIILTNDDDLAGRLWSVHNCGRLPSRAWYEHFTIGGNHRLSEIQGALLNAQWQRFGEQNIRRNQNARYLAEALAEIPGIYPQRRDADCTCHGCHLLAFRLVAEEFGVSRELFLKAIQAEGIPAVPAYPIPLYDQEMFKNLAFGPYVGYRTARSDLDYKQVHCPNCEKISFEQGVWLLHTVLLGNQTDMDDIIQAVKKVHANSDQLN
jgi:dTDP-4-amino-4,6-dideoxygalactose transaminase